MKFMSILFRRYHLPIQIGSNIISLSFIVSYIVFELKISMRNRMLDYLSNNLEFSLKIQPEEMLSV